MNFTKGDGSYQKALDWGKENELIPSKEEDIESMKENDLPSLFNKTYGYIVETTGNTFGSNAVACGVWFDDSERESYLRWQSDFDSDVNWFCFRKSLALDTQLSSEPQSLVLRDAMKIVKEAGYKIYKEF